MQLATKETAYQHKLSEILKDYSEHGADVDIYTFMRALDDDIQSARMSIDLIRGFKLLPASTDLLDTMSKELFQLGELYNTLLIKEFPLEE